jgi:acyl-CoA synthetase (NDP forming)
VATHSPAFADRLEHQLLEYKAEVHATGAKVPIVLWVAGRMSAAARERLRQHGVAVFEDPNRCMRAVKALAEMDRSAAAGGEPLAGGPLPAEITLAARTTEFEALEALRAAGVPAIESVRCATAADAADAAVRLGGRVVVKASAAALAHKSDAGAVIVGVEGSEAVSAAHQRVVDAARVAGAVPDGSIVQAMAPDGVELIVGARRDPKFGPVLVVAPGGLGAELTTDVARRLLPLRTGEAEAMLRELRSFPLLAGYRSQPPADIPAGVAAIEALARFAVAAGDRLQAVEINPLIVHREGRGASAVDGLILLEE